MEADYEQLSELENKELGDLCEMAGGFSAGNEEAYYLTESDFKCTVETAREQLLIADIRPGGGRYLFNQFDTD